MTHLTSAPALIKRLTKIGALTAAILPVTATNIFFPDKEVELIMIFLFYIK
jgi:hypothetical protein